MNRIDIKDKLNDLGFEVGDLTLGDFDATPASLVLFEAIFFEIIML